MAGFKATKDAIVTILGNVSTIGTVYGYPEPSPADWPCAIVVATGGSFEQRFDNQNNELRMEFKITVMIQLDYTQAKFDLLYEVADAAIAELRKTSNDTLAGTVHAFDVAPAIEFVYTTDAAQPTMACTFTVAARKLMSIT